MKVSYISVILFLLFESSINAQDWQFLGLGDEFITALAIDWAEPEIIYAGSASNFSTGKVGGIFKSTNGGADWDTLIQGVTALDLDIHPKDSKTIYAALGANALTQAGIIKSFDGGNSWVKADSGVVTNWEVGVRVLEIDPKHPDTLYAGTGGFGSGKPYKSTNGGKKWTQLDIPPASSITCMTIDPINTNNIYFGTDFTGYLFKTTDGGTTWKATGLTDKAIIYDVKVDPRSSEKIYAGVLENGFFMSSDGGESWLQKNEGLPKQSTVLSIQLNLDLTQTKVNVYLNANASLGIYVLNTNSEWEKFGNVGSWFITLFENKLYAGSYQGIYVSDIVTSLENKATIPSSINLYQNYPNPFNSTTQIKFEISREENVSVKVFDILGRKVNTLVNERKLRGIYTINWNGTDDHDREVSSGLYICSLRAGSEFKQLKIVLTK